MTDKQPAIASLAVAAIGNPTMAALWMHQRRPLFGGLTPLEALDNPEGRRRVRQQLEWFAGHRPHASRPRRPADCGALASGRRPAPVPTSLPRHDLALAVENPGLRR